VIGTLLAIHGRVLRGRAVRWLRLLRQPRYLLGLLAGLAWLSLWIGRPLLRVGRRLGSDTRVEIGAGRLLQSLPPEAIHGLILMASVLVTVLVALWWLAPWGRPALQMTEAELSLLLQAPLSRRQVVQYALLRNQPGILLGTLILTVFMGFGGPGRRLVQLACIWLLLTVWDLHATARHLWRARTAAAPPSRAWRRRGVLAAILLVYAGAVAVLAWRAHFEALGLAAAGGGKGLDAFRDYLTAWSGSSPLSLLLLPARLALAPLAAAGGAGLGLALLGPLLLALIHHEWVVRTPQLFEDQALAHARRKDSRTRAARTGVRRLPRGRHRRPFPLPPVGRAELAVVWKNLMQERRLGLGTTLALVVGFCLLLMVAPAVAGIGQVAFPILALAGTALLVSQPMMTGLAQRHDLRTDLLHTDILRTWPLSGAGLAAAEILTPVLSAALWMTLGLGLLLAAQTGPALAALLAGGPAQGLAAPEIWQALGAPAPVAIPLALLGVLPAMLAVSVISSAVQNLAALWFPGWIRLGPQRRGGAAQLGQNLLVIALLMLSIAVGLLPGVLVAGTVGVGAWLLGAAPSIWWAPVLGLALALPLLAEGAGLILLAGRAWDRFDPSAQPLEAT
jgi:hypothetical protein